MVLKVYRRAKGLGSPQEIQTGDIVTFWAPDRGATTRVAARVIAGHIEMECPDWSPEREPYLVPFGEVSEVVREVPDITEANQHCAQADEPLRVEPDQKPRKRRKRRVPTPPAIDIMDLISPPGDGQPKG